MSHPLWQSIPFVCILLPLGSAAITSVLKGKAARLWTSIVLVTEVTLTAVLMVFLSRWDGGSFTYTMGHYTAPWGNEIRAGQLEAIMAHFFAVVMLFSLWGGMKKLHSHVMPDRHNLYCVLLLLMTAALNAQVFTNDLFTAYVFVEIMTISAGALIAARTRGRTLVAATRYMIMNLLGSGLFLLGITLLYDLTGHLLMSNIKEAVAQLYATGEYHEPLTVVIALMTAGLCIKSALFPFHTWVPDAYGYTTPTSQAVLSSLVSKGYIFLLMKIYYRVIGLDVLAATHLDDVLFVFAVIAMVMGSVLAIRQTDIRRMIAYSSVAQIGYIFLGIGLLDTQTGMVAACFHIISHSLSKSMLFLAAGGLSDASGDKKDFRSLRGSGYRAPMAGIAFTVGALGMVGFPFLGGFTSKINFALGAMEMGGVQMLLVLLALVISTALNTMYFLRTVVTLYRSPVPGVAYPREKAERGGDGNGEGED